ncbi:MAG TPA: B-box zinc finger protein, partial [Myxococcaceae bacterium]|nr:B-box zinc finger protein [Myxococcaceae bacterium]
MAEMAGGGARCAIHGDVAATLICDRCGNFMCSECSLGGTRSICPSCAALVGTGAFPFTRDNWEFGKVWDFAWSAFKREWLMLSVAVLISILIPGMIVAVANGIQSVVTSASKSIAAAAIGTLVSQLITTLVQALFEMGLVRICLDVLAGQKADIGRLFSQFSKAGVMIVQKLLLFAIFLVPLTGYFAVLTGVAVAMSGGSIDLSDPTHVLDHLGDSPAPVVVF